MTLPRKTNDAECWRMPMILTILPILIMVNSAESWQWASKSVIRRATTTNLVGTMRFSSCVGWSSRNKCSQRRRSCFTRLQMTCCTHEEVNNHFEEDATRTTKIAEETLSWIQRVVIGMEFCPFAAKPYKQKQLYVEVVLGDDEVAIANAVVSEMIRLYNDSAGTTVVVTPDFKLEDFHEFYTFVQWIEQHLMEEYDLHGYLQIVPFHPLYEFAGSGSESIDNYTNRSPYPMIHIIREEDVSKAVDSFGGDASKVWQRNVALLEELEEKLGKESVKRLLINGEEIDGADEIIRKTT